MPFAGPFGKIVLSLLMPMRLFLILLSGLILVLLAPGRVITPSEARDAVFQSQNKEAVCFRDDRYGKMALSTADIELFIVKRSSEPIPGTTSKTALSIFTQKCLYVIHPGNFEPEAMGMAQLVEQHSPHVYLMISPRGQCYPLKMDATAPIYPQNFSPTIQCGATLHGVLIKKPPASP